jgi:hypothetical protein
VIAPLHCSESFCDLHDYQINTSGICLRQDALRQSSAPRSGSHDEDLAGVLLHLGEILERMERRQPQSLPTRAAPETRRREQRKGGTPL